MDKDSFPYLRTIQVNWTVQECSRVPEPCKTNSRRHGVTGTPHASLLRPHRPLVDLIGRVVAYHQASLSNLYGAVDGREASNIAVCRAQDSLTDTAIMLPLILICDCVCGSSL